MVSMLDGFLNDRVVQVSIYAAIVFYIVAHPETFKFVDSTLGLGGKDKNTLLLVHSVVVAVLMYFGTKMIFDPVMRNLVDGFRNSPKKAPARKPVGRAPSRAGPQRKASPKRK